MHFIIGLGNPGSQYEGTRHNVGFEVVDLIAKHLRVPFKEGKGDYLVAIGSYNDHEVGLAKPLTYVNNSGFSVMEICKRYGIPLDHLLNVCDDFQLPLGFLRLRAKGSDGGHNGLYSIIYHLQTHAFPRLRCGIASESTPKNKSMAQFVLEAFTPDEQPIVQSMVEKAKEACLSFVCDGLEKAMNKFNTKKVV